MRRILATAPAWAAALALAACSTAVAPAAPDAVQAQVAKAHALAGEDWRQLLRLCDPQPAKRAEPGPEADEGIRKLMARPAPPATQVFDNLYYVGGDWVSAWLLKTSDGFILIDALNNEAEARTLIEGGMAALGLDPRQIRYIVVTHGHGDHYGGASYLAAKYKARVVASEDDWAVMDGHLEFSSAVWPAPPARDIAVKGGARLTLGDTTVTLYETPGHSPGTLSPVFEVRSGGERHRAMLWGGTGFNFGKDFPRLDSYAASADRMRKVAAATPVDVFLSNHASFDASITKMQALRSAKAPGRNPFVVGEPAVERALEILATCARAQTARFRQGG